MKKEAVRIRRGMGGWREERGWGNTIIRISNIKGKNNKNKLFTKDKKKVWKQAHAIKQMTKNLNSLKATEL